MISTNHWGKHNAPLFEIGDLVIYCGDEHLIGRVARSWWVVTPLNASSEGNWEYLIQSSLLPESWYHESSLSLPDPTQNIYRWVRRWCRCLHQPEGVEALVAIAGLTHCLGQETPDSLTDDQQRQVCLWLDKNLPQAYRWATEQLQ